MLTKEQIEAVKKTVRMAVLLEALHRADAETICDLAAAYERVTALRDDMRAKADRDLSGTHTHFANLLDRALEG